MIDRNTWNSLNTDPGKGMQIFKSQLVQNLNESFSPGTLASQISASNRGVSGGALKNFSHDFPSGASATANVANAYAVHISWETTGAGPYLLTMNNLLTGSPVTIQVTNTTGGGVNLKMAATNGSGVAYAINAKSAAYVNMVSTGVTIGAGVTLIFNGNSSIKGTTPDLELVYN